MKNWEIRTVDVPLVCMCSGAENAKVVSRVICIFLTFDDVVFIWFLG